LMGRLDQKVAIVTGAAKGLGRATAMLFAAEGAIVVLSDFDAESGNAAATAIGDRAQFQLHDVTLDADWERVVGETVRAFGRVDILVNNAGLFEVGTIESQTVQQWDRVNAVVATGTFLGCKHVVGTMKSTGGGAIVNVASIASLQGMPYAAAYCAAKGAVEALTRSVAVHCAEMKYAIRCNSLHPGPIDTSMVHSIPAQMATAMEAGMNVSPRQGATSCRASPEEIAEAVLYLSSDAAKWVNGTRLVVDNTASVMSVISGVVLA
jgi:3(or 17)beta-hydroxysteroid dehydrogenase